MPPFWEASHASPLSNAASGALLGKPRRRGAGKVTVLPRAVVVAGSACSEEQPTLREPRHAWWRELLAWPGNARGNAARSFSCDGCAPSIERNARGGACSLPVPSSGFACAYEPPGSGGGQGSERKASLCSSTAEFCPAVPSTPSTITDRSPSEHLLWAKHVRSLQGDWIREHRAFTRPSTKRRYGRRNRPPLHKAPVLPVRDWAEALRCPFEEGLEPVPADWQERKSQRLRRQWALQRLRSFQQKWRQDHKEWWQRRRQERGWDQTSHDLDAEDRVESIAEESDHEEPAELGSALTHNGNWPTCGEISFLRSAQSRDGAGSRRLSACSLNMLLIESGDSLSNAAPGSNNTSPMNARSQQSSVTSPSSSEVSYKAGEQPTSHESGAQPRHVFHRYDSSDCPISTWSSPGDGGAGASARPAGKHVSSGMDGSANPFSEQAAQRRPSSMATVSSIGMSDRGSACGEPVVDHVVRGDGAWSDIFNSEGELLDVWWTPSYVSSCSGQHTGTSTLVSSKRNSTTKTRATPLFEEDDRVDVPLLEREQTGSSVSAGARCSPRSDLSIASAGSTSSPTPCSGSVAPPRRHRHGGVAGSSQRRASTGSWEEWRTDFPIEVLNALAEFFETFPRDGDGGRVISLVALEAVTSKVLGFPPNAIDQELTSRAQLGDPKYVEMGYVFSCLSRFLDLIRSTVNRVSKESADLLWSSEDLQHIATTFQRHANGSGRLPVAQLFAVVQDLGFDELEVEQVDQQRWLANITAVVIENGKQRHTICDPAHVGSLSFQELCRIVTRALHEKERGRRALSFSREQDVRRQCGFALAEMEDLRELHNQYLAVEVQGNNGALPRLVTLFHICGVRDFSTEEVAALKVIVQSHLPDTPKPAGGMVPFDIFMLWMKDVFAQGVGDLRLHNRPTGAAPDLDRQGFAAAMLREMHSHQFHEATSSSGGHKSHKKSSRRASLDHKGSNTASRRVSTESRWGLGKMVSMSNQGSRAGSSRNIRQASRLANGSKSRGSSRQGSRCGSWGNSRSNTRSNSMFGTESLPGIDSGGARAEDGGTGVFLLKGLPPSEAMLARKQFRAISVDLSNVASDGNTAPSDHPPQDLGALVGSTEKQLSDVTDQAQQERCAERRLDEHAQKAAAKDFSKLQQELRKVKRAQDSLTIVTDAIAKLEAEQHAQCTEVGDDVSGGDADASML